jgi:hypothetical protein
MCLRHNARAGLESYESLPDAIAAAACKCPPALPVRTRHCVVRVRGDRLRVHQRHTAETACGAIEPALPRLADEPRRWPKPTVLNEPLTPRRPPA